MSLKEKINYEMVFPKEILKEANEIFKALPSEKKSILMNKYLIERLERKRLWDMIEEIKKVTATCEKDYDYDGMDEMDQLDHFQKYHEVMITILSQQLMSNSDSPVYAGADDP